MQYPDDLIVECIEYSRQTEQRTLNKNNVHPSCASLTLHTVEKPTARCITYKSKKDTINKADFP